MPSNMCKVPWCDNNKSQKSWVSFYCFPKQHNSVLRIRKLLWCKATGIDVNKIKAGSVLCSVHFSSSQFVNRQKLTLKKTAVPYLTNPGVIGIELENLVARELSGTSASASTSTISTQQRAGTRQFTTSTYNQNIKYTSTSETEDDLKLVPDGIIKTEPLQFQFQKDEKATEHLLYTEVEGQADTFVELKPDISYLHRVKTESQSSSWGCDTCNAIFPDYVSLETHISRNECWKEESGLLDEERKLYQGFNLNIAPLNEGSKSNVDSQPVYNNPKNQVRDLAGPTSLTGDEELVLYRGFDFSNQTWNEELLSNAESQPENNSACQRTDALRAKNIIHNISAGPENLTSDEERELYRGLDLNNQPLNEESHSNVESLPEYKNPYQANTQSASLFHPQNFTAKTIIVTSRSATTATDDLRKWTDARHAKKVKFKNSGSVPEECSLVLIECQQCLLKFSCNESLSKVVTELSTLSNAITGEKNFRSIYFCDSCLLKQKQHPNPNNALKTNTKVISAPTNSNQAPIKIGGHLPGLDSKQGVASPICPSLSDNLSLLNPTQTYHNTQEFACKVCPARFTDRFSLFNHTRTYHIRQEF